jgi:hypothetical protein
MSSTRDIYNSRDMLAAVLALPVGNGRPGGGDHVAAGRSTRARAVAATSAMAPAAIQSSR